MSNYRTFDYNDLQKIEWSFNKDSKSKLSTMQNIITFDIETSNGYRLSDGKVIGLDINRYVSDKDYANLIDDAEAQSLLYVWQCSVESMNGDIYTFFGRTWNDYYEFLMALTREIRRAELFGGKGGNPVEYDTAMVSKRNIKTFCYIHNLAFEFQHLLNLFDEDFTKRYKKQKMTSCHRQSSSHETSRTVHFLSSVFPPTIEKLSHINLITEPVCETNYTIHITNLYLVVDMYNGTVK